MAACSRISWTLRRQAKSAFVRSIDICMSYHNSAGPVCVVFLNQDIGTTRLDVGNVLKVVKYSDILSLNIASC